MIALRCSVVFGGLLLVHCAQGQEAPAEPAPPVRTSPESTTDLSGRWNDSDARLTADALIADCLSAAWLEGSKRPAVTVAQVVNRTTEFIDPQFFVKSLERALVNSGRVEVLVQRNGEMAAVEAEQLLGASGRFDEETAPKFGKLIGADYVAIGTIASVEDAIAPAEIIFYQVNMELLDTETGRKAWVGQHKIKKRIDRGEP
ncbi:MAG: penicillin-binding protein activator LpoB [Myxococcota bacterium]